MYSSRGNHSSCLPICCSWLERNLVMNMRWGVHTHTHVKPTLVIIINYKRYSHGACGNSLVRHPLSPPAAEESQLYSQFDS